MAQNVGRKSESVRRHSLKTLWKCATKNGVFFLYFRHLLRRLENCKIYHVLHWYASLVKILLKLSSLRLIWGHLGSFQFIYRLTHLSLFRSILSSDRIILNIVRVSWVRLRSSRPILVYLGSFRLIWAHLDSLELIKTHLSSFRLIQALSGLFRLIWALLRPFRLIYGHLSLF